MSRETPRGGRVAGLILTLAIVELTLTTAYIHYSLGGLLFTLNAMGYAVLAASLVVVTVHRDGLVGRLGWLPRIGLAGYTLATIAGYLVMGPYFALGWIAKAVEVAILTLLVADLRTTVGPCRTWMAAWRARPDSNRRSPA
jgi:FtsH-binding integral membrane protein